MPAEAKKPLSSGFFVARSRFVLQRAFSFLDAMRKLRIELAIAVIGLITAVVELVSRLI